MQEQPSVARVALKYGLITAVVIVVYTTILTVADLSIQNPALVYLAFVILAVGMAYAMKDFRTQNEGFMSYGQGLGIGSLMATIVGLLSSVFSMFYSTFIDPNLMQKNMDAAREKLESQGLSDAQIDQAAEMMQKFQSPGMQFAAGVFSFALFGFIIALIVSAIMRRNKPVFE